MTLNAHREDLLGRENRLVAIPGHLDAASLPAMADLDLRLDDAANATSCEFCAKIAFGVSMDCSSSSSLAWYS
jgi:hypothetical protein